MRGKRLRTCGRSGTQNAGYFGKQKRISMRKKIVADDYFIRRGTLETEGTDAKPVY